jgi:hypothetical protein
MMLGNRPTNPVNQTTSYGPKGKILTLQVQSGSNYTARLQTQIRIDWITIWNTSAVTVNVIFNESTLNPLPIPASTDLELDTFRMAATNVTVIDFTATASSTVNLIWAESPSPSIQLVLKR